MSKGSRRRQGNSEAFKNNFDKIKWNTKSSMVEVKTPTGVKYVSKESLKPKTKTHHIMPDIEPYMPAGGDGAFKEMITSRSKHREYLRRNNCIEVGNEKDYFFKYNGKTHDNPTRGWED